MTLIIFTCGRIFRLFRLLGFFPRYLTFFNCLQSQNYRFTLVCALVLLKFGLIVWKLMFLALYYFFRLFPFLVVIIVFGIVILRIVLIVVLWIVLLLRLRLSLFLTALSFFLFISFLSIFVFTGVLLIVILTLFFRLNAFGLQFLCNFSLICLTLILSSPEWSKVVIVHIYPGVNHLLKFLSTTHAFFSWLFVAVRLNLCLLRVKLELVSQTKFCFPGNLFFNFLKKGTAQFIDFSGS